MKKYKRISFEYEEGNNEDVVRVINEVHNFLESFRQENKEFLDSVYEELYKRCWEENKNVQ